jgi:hypothetical protein
MTSCALLEKLVRGSGRLPPNRHDIEIMDGSGLSPMRSFMRSFRRRACRSPVISLMQRMMAISEAVGK